ncbi:MAG: hypothetical protein RTU63_07790, partial [Candidatus Thorarchaeota archaeon]
EKYYGDDVAFVIAYCDEFLAKAPNLDEELLHALQYQHERPRTGASFYIWIKGIKTTSVMSALSGFSNTIKNEPYVKLALDRLKKI